MKIISYSFLYLLFTLIPISLFGQVNQSDSEITNRFALGVAGDIQRLTDQLDSSLQKIVILDSLIEVRDKIILKDSLIIDNKNNEIRFLREQLKIVNKNFRHRWYDSRPFRIAEVFLYAGATIVVYEKIRGMD